MSFARDINDLEITPKDIFRFWKRVEFNSGGCWNFDSKRYGQFGVKTINIKAHRFSFLLANLKIDNNLLVRHLCHNPRCVNPKHLIQGTIWDNAQDNIRDNKNKKGEDHQCAKISDLEVKDMRDKWATGNYTYKDLSNIFNIKPTTIYEILNNTKRTDPYYTPIRFIKRGTILSSDQIEELKELKKQGVHYKDLSKKFDIAYGHMYQLISGKRGDKS